MAADMSQGAGESLQQASQQMALVMQAFPALLGREFGLSRSRLFAMGRVGQSPCSQAEIAEATMSSASSASRLVDGMVADGLVRRARNPDDRRALLVHLTEAGEELRVGLDQRQAEILGSVVTRLGTDVVERAAASLELLLGALIQELDTELHG